MNFGFPDRLYYKIGEVARIIGVRTSVLRFWESEFAFLKPEKSSTGQRLYTKKEVELILEVKHLLYTEKYTIDGVRKRLGSRRKQHEKEGNVSNQNQKALLKEIKLDLLALRRQMQENYGA